MSTSKLEKSYIDDIEWNLHYEGPDPPMHWDIPESTKKILDKNDESLVFQQEDLFPSAFPIMADIRRQGKLCDVVLKVSVIYS